MDHHKIFHLIVVYQVEGKVIDNYNNDYHWTDETPILWILILLVDLQLLQVYFEWMKMIALMVLKELI